LSLGIFRIGMAGCLLGFMVAVFGANGWRRGWRETAYHDFVVSVREETLVAGILLSIAGILLTIVSLRTGAQSKQPRRKLYFPTTERPNQVVQLVAQATLRDEGVDALIDAERVCLDAVTVYNYVSEDGPEGGVSNYGLEEMRAALPSITRIGLAQVSAILAEYLDLYESYSFGPEQDEETTRVILEDSRRFEDRLSAAGLFDIPDRLDAYLEIEYPWL